LRYLFQEGCAMKMKNSEVLKKAKTILAHSYPYNGKEEYICFSVAYALRETVDECRSPLMAWIAELISPWLSFETWINEELNIGIDSNPILRSKLQETRHRWIDWMIQYWEEQEGKS